MIQASERTYGFTYVFKGKEFASHVIAESRDEAERKVAALKTATLEGELRPHRENANQALGSLSI